MVTDEYRPYIGGAGRCIELFAQELSRLGHTVAIATAWHADAPAFEDDGQVRDPSHPGPAQPHALDLRGPQAGTPRLRFPTPRPSGGCGA